MDNYDNARPRCTWRFASGGRCQHPAFYRLTARWPVWTAGRGSEPDPLDALALATRTRDLCGHHAPTAAHALSAFDIEQRMTALDPGLFDEDDEPLLFD